MLVVLITGYVMMALLNDLQCGDGLNDSSLNAVAGETCFGVVTML